MTDTITYLFDKISGLNEPETLRFLSDAFPGEVVFSSSFSWEDQAITHMILSEKLPIEIFTLDTGRLFSETYYVWNRTNETYGTNIKPYYPQHEALEKYVTENGPNAFYESPELRKTCCHIRKVEPLNRALKGKKVWITGLRAAHSPERENLEQLEWDESHQLFKYHPLLHWTTDEVKDYIAANHIPYNTLHDKGFVSIGCAPCTRAIREGENFRAGRWWWEDNSKKECGLHVH
ncbi:phosphoadenosine phosphosulfate reductase [Arachidicoccus ginsenosidimutans]|uniref:phosphoadenylyl-sulfate reductase n=1 Tax=Arachidicoccus sp. BS20 TaxID=1850526 RepID=UPI0007F0E41B|nr:phosphoadenylyl-sulfate reductase [Arachidicoccus sp. BS20]ANI89481.1 phosphoadenosine phosphosulfate reductase [Arachidicoccus sp. BS20]